MINRLANYNENVSINIHSVFQNAYKIEAQLIGTDEFPPQSRNAKDIKNSKSFFSTK